MQTRPRNKHTIFHYIVTSVWYIGKSVIASLVWFVVGIIGVLLFYAKKGPFDLLFGLPLLVIGIGFVLNSLLNIVLSIFSPTYNRGVCILCKQ